MKTRKRVQNLPDLTGEEDDSSHLTENKVIVLIFITYIYHQLPTFTTLISYRLLIDNHKFDCFSQLANISVFLLQTAFMFTHFQITLLCTLYLV